MTLGSYTFERNPSIYSQPQLVAPVRRVAAVETYDSIAVFSWGASVTGSTINLDWAYLPDSQYQSLLALLVAGTAVVFDPMDGSDKTYNVEVMKCTGKYHYRLLGTGAEDVWRSQIKVELLILGEVVA